MTYRAFLIGRARLQMGVEKSPGRVLYYRPRYNLVRIRATGPPETVLLAVPQSSACVKSQRYSIVNRFILS